MKNVGRKAGKRALVLGGGIAGLLAARVLSDSFEEVTLLEQEENPDTKSPRRFAPQGNHVHTVLRGGADVMERLFPGFAKDLIENGAHPIGFYKTVKWYEYGVWKMRDDTGNDTSVQSRPLLEWVLRQRTSNIDNIKFKYNRRVLGYIASDDKKAIIGLRVKDRNGEETEELADLVVDAGGRPGKTMDFLKELDAPLPVEELIGIDLGYSSMQFENIDRKGDDYDMMIVHPHPPHSSKAGFIFRIENNRWIVSLGGNLVSDQPGNHPEFLEYSRILDIPEVYEAIRDATPVTDVVKLKVAAYRRRYFEKIKKPPRGLVVIGDALLVPNPILGMGMMMAAKEVEALEEALRECEKAGDLSGLPGKYYKKASVWISNCWTILQATDLRYSRFKKQRPPGMELLGWYVDRCMVKSASSKHINQAMSDVIHFQKKATHLFTPGVLFRALIPHGRKAGSGT